MDPVSNPFAPGAGTPPPELAGRDELRETVRIALERTRLGRPTKSILMVGLRGVGKTVLLDRMRDDAEATGIHTLRVEAPESRSLPAILAPQLRQALLRLSRNEQAKDLAQRALRGLAGFAKALKVKFEDIEVGLDFEPEPGLADNGDLEHDLQALLEAAGAAAQKAGTALVMFVDELQYVEEDQLAALITAGADFFVVCSRQEPCGLVQLDAMARGFSNEDLAAGADRALVAALDDEDLVVRRYASKCLYDIVQPSATDRLRYRPDGMPDLRREGVNWWQGQLEKGLVRRAGTQPSGGAVTR